MSTGLRRWLGPLLWLLLALPLARHALQLSMTRQMLLQIPLLALSGWWLRALLPPSWRTALGAWNWHGATGLLLASLVSIIWMLPISMDAALQLWWAQAAKFTSVPLLIGLALALSWPRAGFVLRGVFLFEALATLLRAGWLYLAAPQQLCVNYLSSDQQRLGRGLLLISGAVALLMAWKLMCGRIDIGRPSSGS